MNVALLTDSDTFAGTESHMLDLALELRALHVAPVLVCPERGQLAERSRAEGLPVAGLEKRGRIGFSAIRQLSRWLAAGKFDLVHAHNGRTKLQASLARRLAGRGAVVATQHFLEPTQAKRRGLARVAGRLVHQVADRDIACYVAISQAVAEMLLARGETDPSRLRVVLNGVRDPREHTLEPAAAIRARFGVAPETPLIVCLARLEAEKGVEILVDAMRLVAAALPGAHCLIAGRGSLEGALQARIGAVGNVRLAGFVEDPLSLLQASDLFVLPSVTEPFGLAIVEAMALAKPVIAARAGGPLEIVRSGETGLLVAPGEAEPMAAAIVSILSRAGVAPAMGQAARADYLARFTARRMATEMLEVYRSALRLSTGPGNAVAAA